MKFENLHDYEGSSAYLVPNEKPLIFREMLKNYYIQRAAGICSAGEVGLFGLLPTVRKDLTLVDHCYGSLAVAMIKVLMIEEYGWEETLQLLTAKDYAKTNVIIDKMKKKLPKPLQMKHHPPFSYQNYDQKKGKYVDSHSPNGELSLMWQSVPKTLIKQISQKLDLVTFLHGDLTDLIERGPYDLVYVSNAFGHVDRTRLSPRHAEIEKIVKPGGLIIGCETVGKMGPKWKLLKEARCGMWKNVLYQVPE